jgi:predicted phosphodiesterase
MGRATWPDAYSTEAREICERWDKAGAEGKMQLARDLKVSYTALSIFRSKARINPELKKEELPHLPPELTPEDGPPDFNIPEISLHYYKAQKSKSDPEEQCLVLSDLHSGEKTPSFDSTVLKRRLANLWEDTLRITYLHRSMYPVNVLNIFLGGDMVHGENPYQGAKVGNIECGAQQQVFEIALPELASFILSCRQEFAKVRIYAVPGNHGRYSKEAPETSNWDIFLYKALANQLARYDGIEFHISEEFNQIVEIQGFKFFLFHGDQIRSYNGIPYFGISRKLMSWYITFGGFSYAICLPPQSKVWHYDGTSTEIQNIAIGDKVLSGKGNIVNVKEVLTRQYTGEIKRVKLEGFPYSLEATPEHPIVKKKKGWVPISDIKVGDYIRISYPKKVRNWRASPTNHKRLSADWCNLVGIFLAEGYADKYQVKFGFHSKETDFIDRTRSLLNKFYGKRGNLTVDGNSAILVLCSAKAAKELTEACGHLAWDKKLAPRYMLLPISVQKNIILSWLEGDGYCKGTTYRGYTTSEILANQMFIIALRLGWHPRIFIQQAKAGHRRSFCVHISVADIKGESNRHHSHEWYRVGSIETELYDGTVYNLAISGGKNADFTYNSSGIAVHNCGHWHKDDLLRVSAKTKLFMNGAFPTDDAYSLKIVGTSAVPCQWTFGVHARKGVTWSYSLITDPDFLPVPLHQEPARHKS